MKRIKVLFGQRRMMVLVTLTILVLAAVALAASSASFTSTSANPGNVFTAGNLTLTDDDLTFTAGNMMPGDTKEGTVQFTTTSDGDSTVYVKAKSIADTVTGPAGERLSTKLHLYIVTEPAGVAVWDGQVTAAELSEGVVLGTFAAGTTAHSYKFTMEFPDGDTGSTLADKGADDGYQSCSSTVEFEWVAASN